MTKGAAAAHEKQALDAKLARAPLLILETRGDARHGPQTIFAGLVARHPTGALVIYEAWQLLVINMKEQGHDLEKNLLALAEGLLRTLDAVAVIGSKALDDALRLLRIEPGLGGVKYPHGSDSPPASRVDAINKCAP